MRFGASRFTSPSGRARGPEAAPVSSERLVQRCWLTMLAVISFALIVAMRPAAPLHLWADLGLIGALLIVSLFGFNTNSRRK